MFLVPVIPAEALTQLAAAYEHLAAALEIIDQLGLGLMASRLDHTRAEIHEQLTLSSVVPPDECA